MNSLACKSRLGATCLPAAFKTKASKEFRPWRTWLFKAPALENSRPPVLEVPETG